LDFRFQEKSDVYSLAPTLANNLNFYPEEHVVSVGSILDTIEVEDLKVMREYMELILPERSVTIIRDQVGFLSFTYLIIL